VIQRALHQWARLIGAEADLLRERPSVLFQQAASLPDSTAPAQAAARRHAAGLERRPWLRWVNKDQRPDQRLLMLVGHTASITGCRFSPDGARIVSSSTDRTLRVWDAHTGKLLLTVDCGVELHSVVVSPDGSLVAAPAADSTVRLIELATGIERGRFPSGAAWSNVGYRPRPAGFSPDGKRLICPTGQNVTIWEIPGGRVLGRLAGHSHTVTGCALLSDGVRAITVSLDRTLRCWNTTSGEVEWETPAEKHFIDALAVPGGGRLVTGSERGTLRMWDAQTGDALATHRGHADEAPWVKVPVNAIAVSPAGDRFATGSNDATLRLWNAASGALLATFQGHQERVEACAFSPDGRRLVSGSWDSLLVWDADVPAESAPGPSGGWEPVDGTADLQARVATIARPPEYAWEETTGERYLVFERSQTEVRACAVSRDGGLIATAAAGTVQLWDGRTGAPRVGWPAKALDCCFSPNGLQLLAALGDGTLELRDATTGVLLRTLKGHTEPVVACLFAPNGHRILSRSSTALRLWSRWWWWRSRKLKGHKQVILSSAISPDGKRIVTGDSDRRVLFRTARGRVVAEGKTWMGEAFAFSPDGALLANSAGDVWDARSGAPRDRFPGVGTRDWQVSARPTLVGFTPDGRHFVALVSDVVLGVFSVESRSLDHLLEGHRGPLSALAISPDGGLVASTAGDATVRVWEIETGQPVALFRTSSTSPVAWTPDGLLAVGSNEGELRLLRLEPGFSERGGSHGDND
jgi:WD40 repeat protein